NAARLRCWRQRYNWTRLVLGGSAAAVLLAFVVILGTLFWSITLFGPTRPPGPPPAPAFVAEDVPAGVYREGRPPASTLETIDRQQDALIAALKDLEKGAAP